MPALVDIRRRIRSVKNTQQITKAMKMVSAAKLRRAQDAMFAARPYARKMMEVLSSMAARAEETAHPLLGRKGRDFFRRRHYRVRSEQVGLFQALRYETAQKIAHGLIKAFTAREVDQVYLVYNEFKSVIQQRVIVERLLPVERKTIEPQEPALDYLYEPGPAKIYAEMLPKHVEIQAWRALLESAAAEHGARMAAMDAATRNAGDMIDRLTLYMNKVRQAAITKEIIEVVSGAGS